MNVLESFADEPVLSVAIMIALIFLAAALTEIACGEEDAE